MEWKLVRSDWPRTREMLNRASDCRENLDRQLRKILTNLYTIKINQEKMIRNDIVNS